MGNSEKFYHKQLETIIATNDRTTKFEFPDGPEECLSYEIAKPEDELQSAACSSHGIRRRPDEVRLVVPDLSPPGPKQSKAARGAEVRPPHAESQE